MRGQAVVGGVEEERGGAGAGGESAFEVVLRFRVPSMCGSTCRYLAYGVYGGSRI